MVNLDPTSSLRQISLEVGLCKSRIQTILRKYKYHPYKAQCHQEIFAVDEESRSAFCYEMQERANNDGHFLSAICFTDECTFTLNNEPNVQNTRYWAQENTRVNISTRTQYPQKINIWDLGVRNFLNDSFPNCWIGRGGAINWPARSPDLAPCDFFLWGHLKSKIYKRRHPDINSLREAITAECALITERQLANVRNAFYNRLGYCLFQNGGLFEYLL
jgi:hypothetical protein